MKYTYIIVLLSLNLALFAQPSIQWQKCLGGSASETVHASEQTTDGGFILAGFTTSNNGDISGNHGGGDCWVAKLNSNGEVQWQRTLGGSSTESAYSIHQTMDDGYILAGRTHSNDGDVSGNHGDWDYWVVKLDPVGQIKWQKTLGGNGDDKAYSIQQTQEGGYIVAGYSNSTDGDVSDNQGYADYWVVKLDPFGIITWQKSLGGANGGDLAYSIQQTSDGGFIVAGESQSTDGDVTGNHGDFDGWIVKLDSIGIIEWQKSLGGSGSDTSNSIRQTNDDGFIIIGIAGSPNGDISGWHGLYDYWVVKLSKNGEIQWQKAFGGSEDDWGASIDQTNDGGYIVIGTTRSTDGDVVDNDGFQDIWVLKLNHFGELQWQKTFGGNDAELASSIIKTNDNGYFFAGETYSNDGDVSGNHGSKDIWVVKLSPPSSSTTSHHPAPLAIYPNPTHQFISVQLPDSFPIDTGDEFPISIRITDLPGREIMHQTIESEAPLNIEAIPNGLYLLTAITNSGKEFSGKFVKQE